MEIFIPLVDYHVKHLFDENIKLLDSTSKKKLASILDDKLETKDGYLSVYACIMRLAKTFFKSLERREIMLYFP